MIALPVTEAEALDYLSILLVKWEHNLPVVERLREIESALFPIMSALDTPQFAALHAANTRVFDAIEKAMRDEISASEVQRVNHERFQAKRALQLALTGQPATEFKSGVC